MYLKYVFLAVVIAALAAAAFFMPKEAHTGATPGPSVTIGGATFTVELARTPAEQGLGLGERDSLAAGRGMLFIFPQAGNWGFWMKDTRFPLDIMWARADGTIITVARDVATSTYAEVPPEVFYPTTPDALYVLEVNAGAAAAVQPGEKMTIRL